MAECNLCGFPVGSGACNAAHGLKEEVVKPKPRRLSSAELAARQMAVGILRAVDSGRLDSRSMAADGLLSWADMHFNVSDGTGIKKLREEETKLSGDHAPVLIKTPEPAPSQQMTPGRGEYLVPGVGIVYQVTVNDEHEGGARGWGNTYAEAEAAAWRFLIERAVDKTTGKSKRKDFIRGFCCATSVLLRENGHDTLTLSLFRQAGTKAQIQANADEYDLAIFREHGLLP